MPRNRRKGDARQIRVVAECREAIDRDLLSVALFGWIVDKMRTENRVRATEQMHPMPPAELVDDDRPEERGERT